VSRSCHTFESMPLREGASVTDVTPYRVCHAFATVSDTLRITPASAGVFFLPGVTVSLDGIGQYWIPIRFPVLQSN